MLQQKPDDATTHRVKETLGQRFPWFANEKFHKRVYETGFPLVHISRMEAMKNDPGQSLEFEKINCPLCGSADEFLL